MARSPVRSVPREHGAWGQLLLPLVTALSLAPSIAGVAFGVTGVCAFFLHEPLRVWFKRGSVLRQHVTARSLGQPVLLFALATVTGLSGFTLSQYRVLPSLGVILPLLLLSLLLLVVHRERTSYGEALVGATLPSFAIPVLLAGGLDWPQVWFFFSAFTAAHGAMTFGVRAVIANTKQHANWVERTWRTLLVDALACGFALYAMPPSWLYVVIAPLAFGTALAAFPPHPRHLRKIGWFFVGVSVAMTIGLWMVLRR